MKMTPESIANLEKVLATCALANIDAVIIEDGTVRGVNDDKSCVIISDKNVPEIGPDFKMGLSRLSALSTRLSLFKSDPQIVVNAKENERGEISSLEISGTTAKVQFRCTSSALIKAPKKINDAQKFELVIPKEQVPFILSGARSMGAKRATVASKKDGTFLEFTDSNQDTFSVRVNDSLGEVFAHQYPTDVFLPLIKAVASAEQPEIVLNIGEIGTMQLMINGYSLTILPQVAE